MELKTYNIIEYKFGKHEVILPDDIQFYRDTILDKVMHTGNENYLAFYKKCDFPQELLKKDAFIEFTDFGEYLMLYIMDGKFIGDHPEYTDKIDVPPLSLLYMCKKYDYIFEKVVYPIRYMGGGRFECLNYGVDFFSNFECKSFIERDFYHIHIPKYDNIENVSVNGKCNDLYRDAVEEIINTGSTRLDLKAVKNLYKAGKIDAESQLFKDIINGNEVIYKDETNETDEIGDIQDEDI